MLGPGRLIADLQVRVTGGEAKGQQAVCACDVIAKKHTVARDVPGRVVAQVEHEQHGGVEMQVECSRSRAAGRVGGRRRVDGLAGREQAKGRIGVCERVVVRGGWGVLVGRFGAAVIRRRRVELREARLRCVFAENSSDERDGRQAATLRD